MAVLAKLARKLRSDETRTAYDYDLDDFPPVLEAIRGPAPESEARMRLCRPESFVGMLDCG